jgi:hypothetical protein
MRKKGSLDERESLLCGAGEESKNSLVVVLVVVIRYMLV